MKRLAAKEAQRPLIRPICPGSALRLALSQSRENSCTVAPTVVLGPLNSFPGSSPTEPGRAGLPESRGSPNPTLLSRLVVARGPHPCLPDGCRTATRRALSVSEAFPQSERPSRGSTNDYSEPTISPRSARKARRRWEPSARVTSWRLRENRKPPRSRIFSSASGDGPGDLTGGSARAPFPVGGKRPTAWRVGGPRRHPTPVPA
jgi:hypothetical protein